MLLKGRLTPRGADPAAAGAGSAGSGTGGPAEEGFYPSYALREKATKKLYGAIVLAAVVGLAGPASAQNKVNIVYPIDGRSYPITDPAPGRLRSAYITASFGVTCSGDHDVKWGFDTSAIGSAKFYDQISEQQVWKLPGGTHVFWVDAGKCGKESVKFKVGPPQRIGLELLRTPGVVDQQMYPASVGVSSPNDSQSAFLGAVVDSSGVRVPSDNTVTAWWDPGKTRPKYVVARFLADSDEQYVYELAAVPPAAAPPMATVVAADSVDVATAYYALAIRPSECLFDFVQLVGGMTLKSACAASELTVRDSGGTPLQLTDQTVVLEESHAHRAHVVRRGTFRRADGTDVARLTVRYDLWDESDVINIDHHLVWLLDDVLDGSAGWSISFQPDSPFDSAALGVDGASVGGTIVSSADSVAFQSAVDVVSVSGAFTVGGAKLDGWITAETSTGIAVDAALRYPWQKYPTTLAVDGGTTLRIGLWPREAPLMRFDTFDMVPHEVGCNPLFWKPQSSHPNQPSMCTECKALGYPPEPDGKCLYIEKINNPKYARNAAGLSRTHHVAFRFRSVGASTPPDVFGAVHRQPPVVRQDPGHATKFSILGYEVEPYGALPSSMEAALTRWADLALRRFEALHEYGFWHFGFMRWGLPEGNHYRWFDGGQYDQQLMPWLLYLRGGDRRYYDEAQIVTDFYLDVATRHHSNDTTYTFAQAAASIDINPWKRGHLTKSSKNHFLLLDAWMTGDRYAREVVTNVQDNAIDYIANHAGRFGDPSSDVYLRADRELYNSLRFMALAYLDRFDTESSTWLQDYVAIALGREFDSTLESFNPPIFYTDHALMLAYEAMVAGGLVARYPPTSPGRWTADDVRTQIISYAASRGYPQSATGFVAADLGHVSYLSFGAQHGDASAWGSLGWDLARAAEGLTPGGALDATASSHYTLTGNAIFGQRFLPILLGGSLGARMGATMSSPSVRRDAHINIDAFGPYADQIWVRSKITGDLTLDIYGVGRTKNLPGELTLTAFDALDVEVATLLISYSPSALPPGSRSTDTVQAHGQLTIPGATAGALYRIDVDSPGYPDGVGGYTDPDHSLLRIDTEEAFVAFSMPQGTRLIPKSSSGQYEMGARYYVAATGSSIRIRSQHSDPFSVNDAATGVTLFVSELGTGKAQVTVSTRPGQILELVLSASRAKYQLWDVEPFVSTRVADLSDMLQNPPP